MSEKTNRHRQNEGPEVTVITLAPHQHSFLSQKGIVMNTTVAPSIESVNWTVTPDVDFVTVAKSDASEWLSPFMLGVQDAQNGEFCLPEIYYTNKGQQREYGEGYESVVGRTLLSDQIMGRQRHQLTEAEMAAELEALQDGMEDDEFNYRHCSWSL